MNFYPKPNRPMYTLVMLVVGSILAGLWFFFMHDELYFKVCAFVVPIAVSSFAIYAFFNEKKQDKQAVGKKLDMSSGEYFETSEWREKYITYKMDHPFEAPKKDSMRKDLLKRYRRREHISELVLFGFLTFAGVTAFIYKPDLLILAGTVFCAALFLYVFKKFSGYAVRKWLDSGMDFSAVEASYLSGKMLTYKANGINLGATHILAYKGDHLYAIDYDIVESVKRKVVRVKNYDNSVYSGDEYKHFAVICVNDPKIGKPMDIGIELNEFQVQMVIDEFNGIKSRYSADDRTSVGETYKNIISVTI